MRTAPPSDSSRVLAPDPSVFSAGVATPEPSPSDPPLPDPTSPDPVGAVQAPDASRLAALTILSQRMRRAGSIRELAFVMVNESITMTYYRQALLWIAGEGVFAVSGVTEVETHAPFILWLDRRFQKEAQDLLALRSTFSMTFSSEEQTEWNEWFPPHGLWIPFRDGRDAEVRGVVLLVRSHPWLEADETLLAHAVEMFGFVWGYLRPSTPFWGGRRILKGSRWWSLWLVVIGLMFVPVHLTVLAPAEVVARDPLLIRSPLEGVVERVLVAPNDQVVPGQQLFKLDTTTLHGRLSVAMKTMDTSRAEYEKTAQQAFVDIQAKGRLAVVAAHVAERQAEVSFLEKLLERSTVRAERAGVVVVGDVSEWSGRPVAVGERILSVADPLDSEIEAWLAVGDAIDLQPGSQVRLFLNVEPLSPRAGRLRWVAYESVLRPDGAYAHRVRIAFAEGEEKARLGFKGTVRLEGERVTLGYWLFRRPLAMIRHALGW